MNIGANIKKYRDLKGFSVQDLADKMNVGKAGIYKWEADENTPSIENLMLLSQTLDVSIIELIGGNLTSDGKQDDNKEKAPAQRAEVYREILETYTGYVLLPKTLLDNHRLISKEQMDRDERTMNKLLDWIEEQRVEIYNLRSQIQPVEKGQKNT